jgi:O-antigen ligase
VQEARPDLLLCVLTLMVLTYVWRIQDLSSAVGALRLNLTAVALSTALLVIDRHPARRLHHLRSPILVCGLALFGLALLGLATSLWPSRSASFLLRGQGTNMVVMLMIAASVRSMRDLEWLALANVVGACAYSVFINLTEEIGPHGRFSELIYYDVNDLSLVLLCTIPFAIHFAIRGSWPYRLVALSALVLFIGTLAKSGSRGGFLGLVVVTAYILLGYKVVSKRLRLLAAVGGFGLLFVLAGEAYWERIATLRNPEQDYNWSGQSAEGRMEVWRRGIGYMISRPIFGVGMRNFSIAEGTLSEESRASEERGRGFKWSVAHNSFLEIGAETGVIGLALFVGMLVFALQAMRRIRARHHSSERALTREVLFAYTLTASLLGFIVAGSFVSAWYFSYLYMVLGMAIGLTKLRRLNQAPVWTGWRSRGMSRPFTVSGQYAVAVRPKRRNS